jgi:hypothetical protein
VEAGVKEEGKPTLEGDAAGEGKEGAAAEGTVVGAHEVTGATQRQGGPRRRARPPTPSDDDSDCSEFQPSTDGLQSSCSSEEELEDGR